MMARAPQASQHGGDSTVPYFAESNRERVEVDVAKLTAQTV